MKIKNNTKRVTILLNNNIYKQLLIIAKDKGLRYSTLIRTLIIMFISGDRKLTI